MERAVEERFERIEALLHAMTVRGEKADIRFALFAKKADQRHEQAMRRMDRSDKKHEQAMRRMDRSDKKHEEAVQRMDSADKKHEKAHQEAMQRIDRVEKKNDKAHQEAMQRLDRADQRMEVFDRKFDATRKLVEAGMKLVMDLGRRQKLLDESMRELNKSQKAFLDSFRKGGNGHGKPN